MIEPIKKKSGYYNLPDPYIEDYEDVHGKDLLAVIAKIDELISEVNRLAKENKRLNRCVNRFLVFAPIKNNDKI